MSGRGLHESVLALEGSGCLDWYKGGCGGPTEPRESLSGTGTLIPRCDSHWDAALDRDEALRFRYPHNAPADFDPSYAGESWDGE